jgi:VanZ family protein
MSDLAAERSRRALASTLKLAFVIAALTVVVLSLLPGSDLPDVGLWDKLEHFIAYGFLALVGGLAFPGLRAIVLLALMLTALGIVMEICQGFVPGRSAEVRDAIADAIGVGLVLFPLFVFRVVRRT